MAGFGDILSSLALGSSQSVRRNSGDTAFEAWDTSALATSVSNSNGTLTISPTTGAVVASIPTTRDMYFGSVACTKSGTITRTGSYISSVALTAGKTITITRSGNYITSITDGTKTWTYTRNASNQITSWSVA